MAEANKLPIAPQRPAAPAAMGTALETGTETATKTTGRRRRNVLFLVPVLVFCALGVVLGIGLTRDPAVLPSTLVGKAAPTFALPPLPGRTDGGLATSDLGQGQVTLVNVFASWCLPCKIEHPMLMRLASEGVRVVGINYKDKPDDAERWLGQLGVPYAKIGSDRDGRAGIEWGVYGVPETFVIDGRGNIAYRQVGPIQERDLERTIKPLLAKLGG